MNTLNQIGSIIDEIINTSRKLVDILEKEKLLLGGVDFERLTQNTETKVQQVEQLEQDCDSLQQCFNSLDLEFNRQGLDKYIAMCAHSVQDDIQRRINLMLNLIAKTESLNQINGVILVSQHNLNQKLISIVTQKKIESDTYGPKKQHAVVSTRGRTV